MGSMSLKRFLGFSWLTINDKAVKASVHVSARCHQAHCARGSREDTVGSRSYLQFDRQQVGALRALYPDAMLLRPVEP